MIQKVPPSSFSPQLCMLSMTMGWDGDGIEMGIRWDGDGDGDQMGMGWGCDEIGMGMG